MWRRRAWRKMFLFEGRGATFGIQKTQQELQYHANTCTYMNTGCMYKHETRLDWKEVLISCCCWFYFEKSRIWLSESQHNQTPAYKNRCIINVNLQQGKHASLPTLQPQIHRGTRPDRTLRECVCVCVINQASRECRCQRCGGELRRAERPPDGIKTLFTSLGLTPISLTQMASSHLRNVSGVNLHCSEKVSEKPSGVSYQR